MHFDTLQGWLDWQATLHPDPIDLGLERVAGVWSRLHPGPFPCPVISVAGTNGKGSSVAFLEAILTAAGYRTASYTSPHLERYNERIRLQGEPVSDRRICTAFERVERARGKTSLTYFEFGTLAALEIFAAERPAVAILEVGLGGRLDAVNIIDPDVALITGVALDHTEWLGRDLESIGREKAGIMRPGRPVVFGGEHPPRSVLAQARALGAPLQRAGRDYRWRPLEGGWEWRSGERLRQGLPLPRLRGRCQLANAAAVLAVLALLEETLPVDQQAIRAGLQAAAPAGRFQVLPGAPVLVLDVAHNPQAAGELRDNLERMPVPGPTVALFAMLGDKAVEAVAGRLAGCIDRWCVTGLEDRRGIPAGTLAARLAAGGVETGNILPCGDPGQALERARSEAGENGRVLVFGSFLLVGAVLGLLRERGEL